MNNRLKKLFSTKNDGILSVFYTAGFPSIDDTVSIARALNASGADIIEIGIPFSDPVADGPTIQQSNKVALDNGITLKRILQQVKEIRKDIQIPIILMGYVNPVMQYGIEAFVKDASAAGVDGVILPDMPLYEYEENYKDLFERHDLGNTFLIAPTTSEDRIRKIDNASRGFIYAVSASSTTGAKKDFTDGQTTYFKKLKGMKLNNPFLIGFGISDHGTFANACNYGAGAIVGSAFIDMLKKSKDIDADIHQFVKNIKGK
jgi:tryptophan synthase alpha chain